MRVRRDVEKEHSPSNKGSTTRRRAVQGPTRVRTFLVFFAIAGVLGILADVCYYIVVYRLAKAGVQVKLLANPRVALSVLRSYSAKAGQNKWSVWPVRAFWALLLPTMIAVAMAFITFRGINAGSVASATNIKGPTGLWAWACLSTLGMAVLFSYRLLRGIISRGIPIADWRDWIRDEYLRNDFLTALLTLIGFAMVAAGLLALRPLR